jgi:cytidylate kinase
MKKLIIAVDGWPGAGKGTLAANICKHYGFEFLDTGTLYRATGLTVLLAGENPADPAAAAKAAQSLRTRYSTKRQPDGRYAYFLGDEDVSDRLRHNATSVASGQVAAVPEVRQALEDFQRQYALNSPGVGVVLDGQDIGTYICPEADVKIFLQGDIPTLAHRRHQDLLNRGQEITYDEVYTTLKARIERDTTRSIRPATPAPDALIIDTTPLTAEQVFSQAKALIDQKL